MKIAIIGGSGFVGSRLIGLLQTVPNIELLNIDKQQSELYPHLTQIADVQDVQKLTELLAGTDLVVLLAAEHKDNVTPASLYYTVNVEGTRNTLQAMESNGVARLVFTSSVAVYGLNKDNPSELHPADPFNDYGRSKWQAECMRRSGMIRIGSGTFIFFVPQLSLERATGGMYIICCGRLLPGDF